MKLAINRRHGGFGLSEAAIYRYAELKGLTLYPEKDPDFSSLTTYWTVPKGARVGILDRDEFRDADIDTKRKSNEAHRASTLYDRDIPRDDPVLIRVIEEMGSDADGRFAQLDIVEVPDDVNWQIEEYDGAEWVAEKHRTW